VVFTLSAGAIADMADRKKILCVVHLFQATIALALAVLGLMNLLSPVVLLISVLLIGTGFAFSTPASSSITAEMVSKETCSLVTDPHMHAS